ncbi:MAG: pimeloyl-ACP methyl ester carboxylesterase [Parasphingorhabdus sp.]|jgi:pimeloyl-ACP methyl ester carboxylesterase
MIIQQAHCSGESIEKSEHIWSITRDFCNPWHPAIETMQAEYNSQNNIIRAFTVKGEDTLYREQLTYFSDTDRSLSYRHLEGIAGVESYIASLSVTPRPGGGSIITMTATVCADSDRALQVAAGTEVIFNEGIAALSKLSKSGTPSASQSTYRPGKLPIERLNIAGNPQLRVFVTPEKIGPVCLFLHGIGGRASNWNAQLQAVGQHIRSASLELRGYGESQLGASQSTIDDYCDDLLRVQKTLGASQLIICGLSYGAWIATSFAMRYPELLSGLILSGGCTGMSEAALKERTAFLNAREAPLNAGQIPADFAPAVVDIIAGPATDEDVRQALRDSMASISATCYLDAVRCFTNPSERFDFSLLAKPVLLMTGEFDRLASPGEIKSIASRIHEESTSPDVRFEVIQQAGHVCNLEEPDQYNHFLLQFLSKFSQ